MTSIETKLRALAFGLNDSALEALASKGLLRRAQKDVERGVPIQVQDEDSSSLRLKVDQFEVCIPEAGPARAKCSCPAAGVCQHILTAVLFLKRDGPSESAKPSTGLDVAENELLAFSREQLEAWAGKASFRAALELASHSVSEISTDNGLLVHFASINSRCHYAPGGGLDGIIVSGNAKDERRVAAAAVIAFQKAKGVTWESPTKTIMPEDVSGAPRNRTDVLEVAQQLLAEMLENGLARISQATQQRLATLAVSATGVNLPRVALTLRGLSDECALITARDARSDLGRLFDRMAHAHALFSALQKSDISARPDLVGWHRTHYDEVGHLDFIGISAWPWRTASGYAGLTLLLWDIAAKRWNSWTDSRPLHQQKDFQPVARYSQPGPWEGAESPRQLARSCFRLMNARRNPINRLSASGKSRVLVTGPSNIHSHGLPIIETWDELMRSLQSQASVGLKESNPLDSSFAVRPTTWARRAYDPVTPVFAWLLLDSQQRPLTLDIAFDQFSEPAMKFLESDAVDSFRNAIVIGRVQRTPQGLSLHPFTVHLENCEPIHLFLDTVKPVSTTSQPVGLPQDDEAEFEEETEPSTASNQILSRLLEDVADALLSIAEAGLAGVNPLRILRIQEIVPRVERFHLEALAAGLKNVVAEPRPQTILRCVYLANLHRKATVLAT
jgi:hypothetical protein